MTSRERVLSHSFIADVFFVFSEYGSTCFFLAHVYFCCQDDCFVPDIYISRVKIIKSSG